MRQMSGCRAAREDAYESAAGDVTLEESGVTESEEEPTAMGKTTEARVRTWIDSVGTVTLPLLAGFSITSVVVAADDAGNFRWPGLTILVLLSPRWYS